MIFSVEALGAERELQGDCKGRLHVCARAFNPFLAGSHCLTEFPRAVLCWTEAYEEAIGTYVFSLELVPKPTGQLVQVPGNLS